MRNRWVRSGFMRCDKCRIEGHEILFARGQKEECSKCHEHGGEVRVLIDESGYLKTYDFNIDGATGGSIAILEEY